MFASLFLGLMTRACQHKTNLTSLYMGYKASQLSIKAMSLYLRAECSVRLGQDEVALGMLSAGDKNTLLGGDTV